MGKQSALNSSEIRKLLSWLCFSIGCRSPPSAALPGLQGTPLRGRTLRAVPGLAFPSTWLVASTWNLGECSCTWAGVTAAGRTSVSGAWVSAFEWSTRRFGEELLVFTRSHSLYSYSSPRCRDSRCYCPAPKTLLTGLQCYFGDQ